MENLGSEYPEDLEWMDTNASDSEATSTNDRVHNPSSQREYSISFAAVGLLQADSRQRESFQSGLVAGRNPFTDLPKEIRINIYEYLTFSPLERDEDIKGGYSARNLALTCRQGKQEWDEERNRRFWIHLLRVRKSHLSETGQELSFPKQLASKHDLTTVRSLKAIITGPFPSNGHYLPAAFELLFNLPLRELVLHYSGSPHSVPTWSTVKKFFLDICDVAVMEQMKPEHITLSWNRQLQPVNTTVRGYTFELNHAEKQTIQQQWSRDLKGAKVCWPVIEVLVSDNMEVGLMQLSLGSTNYDQAAAYGLGLLVELFDALDGLSEDASGDMVTSRIESTHVVNEEE